MSPRPWRWLSLSRADVVAAGPKATVARVAQSAAGQPGAMFLFASPTLDVAHLVPAIAAAIAPSELYGASAGGVLGLPNDLGDGLSVIHVPATDVRLQAFSFPAQISGEAWSDLLRKMVSAERQLGLHRLIHPAQSGFVLLFTAGLSGGEEEVTARLYLALPDLPLVGGAASDALSFTHTFIIDRGQIRPNHNLVIIGHSRIPFRVFQHHHFTPSQQQLVVTALGQNAREVVGIDGISAPEAYAAAIRDAGGGDLSVATASKFPLGLSVQGRWYIRGVCRIAPGRLDFAGALEEGAVLTLMRAGDMAGELDRCLRDECGNIGNLLFNCMGRLLEARHDGIEERIANRFARLPLGGMSTYGEQYMGMHLNHTLTGIAFRQ